MPLGVVVSGTIVVVIAASATLVGAIIGYFWGRSDEKNSAEVPENCCDAQLVDEGDRTCVYACESGQEIAIAKSVMRHFGIAKCPKRVHVCWKTPKGAPGPGITKLEVRE